jgi:FMN reductase
MGLKPPAPGTVAVVVGNPKPASRTRDAALHVAREVAGREPDLVVDLAELGARLLDWSDPEVGRLVADVGDADLVVVASPTYKATFTGILKLFLDRFATATGLSGAAVPLMLGAGPTHALAPELTLRPLLSELGAVVPVRALYVLDSLYDVPGAYADWLEVARPVLGTYLRRPDLEGVS